MGRLGFFKVRWALFKECITYFFGFCRPHAHGNCLERSGNRLLQLLALGTFHQVLTNPQRNCWFPCKCLRCFCSLCQEIGIGDYSSHQAQFAGPSRIEGPTQQNQFGRLEISDLSWKQEAGSELRHEREIDKWDLKPRVLRGVYEVEVGQNGGSSSDRHPVYCGDQRLTESDQRLYQATLRTIARSRRILPEISQHVSAAEDIARPLPPD